jgi:hypothetical protein
MNLIVPIPEELAKRLAAVGASPERVALEALQHAADDLERGQRAAAEAVVGRTPAEAAARIRSSRPGNVLPEGVAIRDLINHGRA